MYDSKNLHSDCQTRGAVTAILRFSGQIVRYADIDAMRYKILEREERG